MSEVQQAIVSQGGQDHCGEKLLDSFDAAHIFCSAAGFVVGHSQGHSKMAYVLMSPALSVYTVNRSYLLLALLLVPQLLNPALQQTFALIWLSSQLRLWAQHVVDLCCCLMYCLLYCLLVPAGLAVPAAPTAVHCLMGQQQQQRAQARSGLAATAATSQHCQQQQQ
jgi:hypothetical protein